MTKFIAMIVMNLVTPKTVAKLKHFFLKLAYEAGLMNIYVRLVHPSKV